MRASSTTTTGRVTQQVAMASMSTRTTATSTATAFPTVITLFVPRPYYSELCYE
ncbi:hypothetical protein [Gilliamella sp. ESL0254]|uniref:hypothetical protein n=1 Tax=Gilliamella sp. ESL0254 TaxID=2705035 RepID=UPI0015808B68|nr:hypothetical protein [Gilliamella sp. ESL0254]NUF26852.1 hypothetical protein [Gilliamella sp. ESL0254]